MKCQFAAAILTCLLLCSCGQKGPLFLPGDRSQVQTELPPLDRESVEEAFEDDNEDETPAVPGAERPPAEDDDAEPFIDPASPRPRSDGNR
jgi:predicted small lipoprotein YifL